MYMLHPRWVVVAIEASEQQVDCVVSFHDLEVLRL